MAFTRTGYNGASCPLPAAVTPITPEPYDNTCRGGTLYMKPSIADSVTIPLAPSYALVR